MADKKKQVFFFGNGKADGNAKMRELLGGKGAGLHEMTRIGVPVPPGFTISTEICSYYYSHRCRFPDELVPQVRVALARVEKIIGRRFGDAQNPLLVSVRSGARESMPGMMDTVLNLGFNDQTIEGLIHRTKNSRFAYDCYRRFIQMYADVVLGIKSKENNDGDPLEAILAEKKRAVGAHTDADLDAEALHALVTEYRMKSSAEWGRNFPKIRW